VKGTPYFAVDVPGPAEEVISQLKDTGEAKYAFGEARSAVMSKFDGFEAALFAEARSMLDWNTRNKVIPRHYFFCSASNFHFTRSFVQLVAHRCTRYGRVGNFRALLSFHGQITEISHLVRLGMFLLHWNPLLSSHSDIYSKGLHNFAHPRSDPVVIMLAVNETGEKILMGHNVSVLSSHHLAHLC
jgi:NAD+ diphosphatase